MNIDWTALGQVFGVSLLATVGVVGVFTLGIIGTTRKPASPEGGADVEIGAAPAGAATSLARVGAYVCFAACVAVVAYGIQLTVA
jgi:hypothetical protein